MSAVHSSSHHDVIIVGGRVAGASTALLLARRGWRVLVLERSPYGSDTRSTHALMKTGVHQLQRWGLLDDVLAAGTPSLHQTTFHYGDESVVVPLQPTTEIPALVAPRRTVLDRILADAAIAAGAEVHFSTRATALLRGSGGEVIGLTGTHADGTQFEARAPLVVGADGARSVVARWVHAPFQVRTSHASAVVHAYFGPDVSTDHNFAGYEWCYRPRGSAGVIPTNGGILAWVGMPRARFENEIRRDVATGFWQVLRAVGPEVHDRVAARERTSRLFTFPGQPGYLRRCAGPGWALVGDASHFTDPLSAHGITDALRDAELLAIAVDEGLRDHAAMSSALERYERHRDELSLPLLRAVDELASYRWTMDEVRHQLRDVSRAMQDELRALRQLVERPEHGAGPPQPEAREGARA